MDARFGEVVRVRSTPETEQAGLAGLVGRVCGETQPSFSGADVIGGTADDFALEVRFDESRESRWLALDLVEFLDPHTGSADRSQAAANERGRPKTEEWQEKDLPSSGWQRFLARLRGQQ